MPRKPQSERKTRDAEQLKRFKAIAREVGADESPGAMDRAFDKVVAASALKRYRITLSPKKGRKSGSSKNERRIINVDGHDASSAATKAKRMWPDYNIERVREFTRPAC